MQVNSAAAAAASKPATRRPLIEAQGFQRRNLSDDNAQGFHDDDDDDDDLGLDMKELRRSANYATLSGLDYLRVAAACAIACLLPLVIINIL
jgi:hypothetical protein